MRHLYFFASSLLFTASAIADPCSSSLNLVSNCGFETGTLADWSLSGVQSTPAYQGISYGVDAADAHSGAYGAYLGGFGGYLSLYQSFATTPGTPYTISYYLAQSPATPAPYVSGFSTFLDGVRLFAAGNAPDLPFTLYQFTATADANLSTLTFSARDDTGFFSLDDISVVATPEPRNLLLMLLGLLGLFLISRVGRIRIS